MPVIRFETTPFAIDDWTILLLPKEASAKLGSRNIAYVTGTINGQPFQTALEPDGSGSHWFKVDDDLKKKANIAPGDTVELTLEASKDWPEPNIPTDIQKALSTDAKAREGWTDTTPMARWEWIRWIRATSNPDTRQHRIEVACSKLTKGMRRPCCFNTSMCTEPAVSKSGVLLEPALK